ncbi:exodeoxyribonuclease VII large subunit [Gracilinema caldarium]|uniref:Exodeoxyribonuclease 7 large subunit n=1 Tax=Gracilinema caldarium (strain ATCC 51460 / DSM 7334 / H1) TaxID=744872 RepID=F8F0S4_GRAC1|nr:exodeoxyribonuclease VII large subunit [Gracilinema caldarium]AEJ19781.1 Exodeoxyribonuclease 7 large subunit [Gracilinema caldarium DSM 7334]
MELEGPLSVSQLTELIKTCLERTFSEVTVEGEISNYRPSSTGHLYFTLKDAGAALQAVMFKNRLKSLDFTPQDGQRVKARGSISVYPQRGTYQLVCEYLEQAGTGDILAMLEERKRRLAAEGLFNAERKKAIPNFPETVGVVSSPTGAAVQDILNILKRRARGIRVILLPTPVQGSDAASIIARRIEQANQWKLADVLIVGRGGGSLEDLLPFSEEVVVRAIADSDIPIISAVGHEIDWALSDFAADLRAPTPSAAAELVSANRQETLEQVRNYRKMFSDSIQGRLDRARLLIKPFAPENLELRFRAILQPRLVRFDDAKESLLMRMKERLFNVRRKFELAVNTLEGASPLAILERGYSVVQDAATGRIIRSSKDTEPGKFLKIRPMEGIITAKTETILIQEESDGNKKL